MQTGTNNVFNRWFCHFLGRRGGIGEGAAPRPKKKTNTYGLLLALLSPGFAMWWNAIPQRNSSTRNCVFCPVDPTEEPQRLNWLVVSTPPKNMKVSWGYYSQYMEKIENVPNHQPAYHHNPAFSGPPLYWCLYLHHVRSRVAFMLTNVTQFWYNVFCMYFVFLCLGCIPSDS